MVPAVLTLAAVLAATPRTLRVDYVHLGAPGEERFAIEAVAVEGNWPGPSDRWIDDTDLGAYRFAVRDAKTSRLIYSRGFSSLYAEWETTEEAKGQARAFHESVRFPEPAGPVRVVFERRDPGGAFREAGGLTVDPADPTVQRTASTGAPWAVVQNGEARDKVDLLLLGDGYTAAEMEKWHGDARRLAERIFSVSPFKERRGDFNVWAVDTPAEESGVARPSDGVHRRSPLGAAYDAFGSERYVLSFDNRRLRDAAAAAPYEFVEIVVNDRKYGGGGIFNLYATVAADNAFTPYILVHEFGHHFAGLADEYYTSEVAYQDPTGRPEPWEPNVTANPQAPRWRELLSLGTPLPTPWAKEAFETAQKEIQARRRAIRAGKRPEAEMEALFREERERMTRLLAPQAGSVGAFEGAMYQARGYYRPQADCIMFTRDEVGFCAVCRRAIERVIELYAAGPRPR